jgi:hypothetical protein
MKTQTIFVRFLFLMFFLFVSILGCTSMKHVESAEGTGKKVTFNKDFESVWTATLSVLGTLPLNIEKNDKKVGKIFAHRPAGFFTSSWGENVGIFVKKISSSQTSIEVVSKKVVSGNIFATDWSHEIIAKISDQIDEH